MPVPRQDDRTTEKQTYSDRIHAVCTCRIDVHSYDIDLIEEHRFIDSPIVEYTYGPARNNIASLNKFTCACNERQIITCTFAQVTVIA